MFLESILGGLLGGVSRLAPEVMSFLDKKNERKHELAMLDKNMAYDKQRAELKIDEIREAGNQQFDSEAMKALTESIKAQAQPSGIKWVDGLSASVRPVLTYWWCMILYTAVLMAKGWLLYQGGANWAEVLTNLWGPAEQSIVSAMIMFWFVGRVFDKRYR